MTSEVDASAWPARYPDLAGKVAVVAGTSSVITAVTRSLTSNGVMVAVVVDNRDVVDAAIEYATTIDVATMGIVADPTERETWERARPHIEQRLGPIDVAVIIAGAPARTVMLAALIPDMAARHRGVVIEAGASVESLALPTGLRHRAVSGDGDITAGDLAAAITLCASNVLGATHVEIALR